MAKYICKICGYVHEGDKAPEKCPQCQQPDCFEVVPSADEPAAPKKKGLNTNSNVYTIVYAAVMVVIVAFLLAFVSDALKPIQDANVLRDTKNQVLTSLNIEGLSGQAVDDKYAEVITDTIQSEEKDIFVANVDGAVKYVLPVKGRGLWGGLWGYIAVNDDKATVYGTYFSHESETAGLGARINERWFQQQFNGKPIFNEAGEIALTVVKQGAATAATEVDGVTGATLTSKGVGAMVTEGLQAYASFLGGAPAEGVCPMGEGHCMKAEGCGRHCEGGECAEAECCEHHCEGEMAECEGACEHKCEGHCEKAEGCEHECEGECEHNCENE